MFPPAELLLSLLLLAPADPGRYPEYARQAVQLERTREECATLEAEVERTGGEIERLDRAGRTEQARALLRESHAKVEALTGCRRKQKARERAVRDLGLEVRRETETELDRALAAGLPRRETYDRIRPLLEMLRHLPSPEGCPIADFEEVEFDAGDPPAVLQEKRLLVGEVLRRLVLQEEAGAARLRDLRSEHDLRRQLSRFMTGLAVEGGAGMFDVRPSEDENQRRLRALEEEAAQCERADRVAEAQLQHWNGKAAELDRLLAGAAPPL